ncbi:VOC family protein [Deinococcus apachensis]|uniref:VOC family protein n=1 Tax=Deinococcus apachensis TaxID=309886 RepID=UPI00037BD3E9|nr:VOC family protein [Deinococcus apachensis]
MPSPILDLAGITLEVNHLPRGIRFYTQVLGLDLLDADEERGVAQFRVNEAQTLTLWKPITRQANDSRLAPLHARGASHLHYAWQIQPGDLDRGKATLDEHGLPWTEIDLGTPERPDPTVYFFDPFGHGLELRGINLADERRPTYLPVPVERPPHALPVMGLREVALAFADYPAMRARLPRAYGLAYAKEQEDRDFAQFTLGPEPEPDGNGTPRRWLYAWDPQVGLADMFGGDHALVQFYARVDEVLPRVRAEGLPHVLEDGRLAVRDPEGHIFEFLPPL